MQGDSQNQSANLANSPQPSSGNPLQLNQPPSSQGSSTQMTQTPQPIQSTSTRSSRKIIATIFAITLLITGVGAGVVLVQREQELRQRAEVSQIDIEVEYSDIRAYDEEWNLLTGQDLENLEPKAVVFFAISGRTNLGNFDKARFFVNNELLGETTNRRPETDEFYIRYQIPEGVLQFDVSAQLHHSELEWL